MKRPVCQLCARFTRLLGFAHMHPLASGQELTHAERCMKNRHIFSCTTQDFASAAERGDYIIRDSSSKVTTQLSLMQGEIANGCDAGWAQVRDLRGSYVHGAAAQVDPAAEHSEHPVIGSRVIVFIAG
jgi:hypothetical protein